jgi:hypothetical protein
MTRLTPCRPPFRRVNNTMYLSLPKYGDEDKIMGLAP